MNILAISNPNINGMITSIIFDNALLTIHHLFASSVVFEYVTVPSLSIPGSCLIVSFIMLSSMLLLLSTVVLIMTPLILQLIYICQIFTNKRTSFEFQFPNVNYQLLKNQ